MRDLSGDKHPDDLRAKLLSAEVDEWKRRYADIKRTLEEEHARYTAAQVELVERQASGTAATMRLERLAEIERNFEDAYRREPDGRVSLQERLSLHLQAIELADMARASLESIKGLLELIRLTKADLSESVNREWSAGVLDDARMALGE